MTTQDPLAALAEEWVEQTSPPDIAAQNVRNFATWARLRTAASPAIGLGLVGAASGLAVMA